MLRTTAFVAVFALSGCVPHLVTSGPRVLSDWEAPQNSWPISETPPPAEVSCGGFDVGDRVCDLRLPDQFGDEVSLWQFWGEVIVVDISTMWCRPCQELAASTQATFEHFEPDGFMYLTVLQEDVEGGAVSQAELNEWGEAFEIAAPILDDSDKATAEAIRQGQFPALLLIDRKMKIVDRVEPPDAAVLDAAIEELIDKGG